MFQLFEFENKALLFWHEIRALKNCLGKSLEGDEVISTFLSAELSERTAPMTLAKARALEKALRLVCSASVLTTTIVDEQCDLLETSGFDLNIPLSAIPGDE